MTPKKLSKLRGQLVAARRSQQSARDLEALAKALGRRQAKRGKEPNWVNPNFPDLHPVSIPHHGGKDIPQGTKNSILDQLEDDLLAWDEEIESSDEDEEADEED